MAVGSYFENYNNKRDGIRDFNHFEIRRRWQASLRRGEGRGWGWGF